MIEYEFYNLTTGENNKINKKGVTLKSVPSALVCLRVDGKMITGASCGEDPLDAVFKAFKEVVGEEIELEGYHIWQKFWHGNSISSALVQISLSSKTVMTSQADKDGSKAFLLALVEAVNQASQAKEKSLKEEINNGYLW
jgi:2-isopropylmalate synthase